MHRSRVLWSLLIVSFVAHAAEPDVGKLLSEILAAPALYPLAHTEQNPKVTVPLRDIGQTVWALELAGKSDAGRALAEFALQVIADAKESERPAGSAPPSVQIDGDSTLPRCYVDAHAVSAILEAAWRHAIAMEPKAGSGWSQLWWPQIFAAGDFVVNWTRGPRGEPYSAYDPALGRDAGGPFESPGALLGVLCAQRLAQLAAKPVPETWKQRHDALEILVRTTDFTDALRTDRQPWGLANLREILAEDHPFWLAPVMAGDAPQAVRLFSWQVNATPAQQIIAARKPAQSITPSAAAEPPSK